MELPVPPSAYRGQTKQGLGESLSIPVAHGEQYLRGTADELYEDGELLRDIRPWLTLDSEPADHQRLQDRLEGWSCFACRGRLFVARLASAGIYDRRAAYFSHARAWAVDGVDGRLDPGVYLGCSAAFDAAEERINESDGLLAQLAPAAMPAYWLPTLRALAPAAAAVLGRLLQALEQGRPLLVAAPLEAFTPGSDLPVLVAFARAALPADLKERCQVRLYTRHPERFVRHLAAGLIALPEDSVAEALSAQPRAVLIDHLGRALKAESPVEPALKAHAQVALAGVLNAPQGLLPFSACLGRQRRRGLRADSLPLLQLNYLLAMALDGDEADRAEVFKDYMRTQGPGLPWRQLLIDEDWARFPLRVLGELALAPEDSLSEGERELQAAVAAAMGRLGWHLDDCLPEAWQAGDARRLHRLARLLAEHPGLFRNLGQLAAQTCQIPLPRWLDCAAPLRGLLVAERQAGVLGRRGGEAEALAELARGPDNCAILFEASQAGQLDPGWIGPYLEKAGLEERAGLLGMARGWFDSPAELRRWGGLALRLLDSLRRFRCALPPDMVAAIMALGESLDIAADWDLYIRLADLLASADPRGDKWNGNPLMRRLWNDLPRLDSPARERLVRAALDEDFVCLERDSLLALAAAEPWPVWREVLAQPLLEAPLLERLPLDVLLECFQRAGPQLSKLQARRAYARLTEHWRQDAELASEALVRWGAWLGWRREAGRELSEMESRQASLAWLRCPLWLAGLAEATLEAWQQAIQGLAAGLSGQEIKSLRAGPEQQGGPLWPYIGFFAEEQAAGLAALCQDLGALLELAEAVAFEHQGGAGWLWDAFLQTHPEAPPRLDGEVLAWLVQPGAGPGPDLDLPAWRYLLNHGGHRQAQMVKARAQAVLAAFATDATQALALLEQTPEVWGEAAFADGWADWLAGPAASEYTLVGLELYLSGEPRRLPAAVSPVRKDAAGKLWERGHAQIARCLNPAISVAPGSYNPVASGLGTHAAEDLEAPGSLVWRVFAALRDLQSRDAVWKDIGGGQFQGGGHPLLELAGRLDRSGRFAKDTRHHTLLEAIKHHPGLLKPLEAHSPRLPVFELYASLRGEGEIANAAWGFVRCVYVQHASYQLDPSWWAALVESVGLRCRNAPSNRLENTLAALCKSANTNIDRTASPNVLSRALKINGVLCAALEGRGLNPWARLLILE